MPLSFFLGSDFGNKIDNALGPESRVHMNRIDVIANIIQKHWPSTLYLSKQNLGLMCIL